MLDVKHQQLSTAIAIVSGPEQYRIINYMAALWLRSGHLLQEISLPGKPKNPKTRTNTLKLKETEREDKIHKEGETNNQNSILETFKRTKRACSLCSHVYSCLVGSIFVNQDVANIAVNTNLSHVHLIAAKL